MKKSATLNQATKILSYFSNIDSNQAQELIESGYLSDVVRTGSLEKAMVDMKREHFSEVWKMIGRLTKFDKIFITVPHDPCAHRSDDAVVYQLRCWEGKIGRPGRGHVDGGVDLFEIMLPAQLKECECCWKQTLQYMGLNMRDTEETEWVKEVRTASDGSKYDLITHCDRQRKPVATRVN